MKQPQDTVINRLSTGELGVLIGAVRSAIWKAIDRDLASLDITTAQFLLFGSIVLNNAQTVAEISRIMTYDSGAMTRLIDRIERKGLLRRVPNPNDRRSHLVKLTATSAQVFPEARRLVSDVYRRLLLNFSDRQALLLQQSLQRLLDNAAPQPGPARSVVRRVDDHHYSS